MQLTFVVICCGLFGIVAGHRAFLSFQRDLTEDELNKVVEQVFEVLNSTRSQYKPSSPSITEPTILLTSLENITDQITVQLAIEGVFEHMQESAAHELAHELMLTLNIVMANTIWDRLDEVEQLEATSRVLNIGRWFSNFLNRKLACANADGDNESDGETKRAKLFYTTFEHDNQNAISFQEGDDRFLLPIASVLQYATSCPITRGHPQSEVTRPGPWLATSMVLWYGLPFGHQTIRLNHGLVISMTIGNETDQVSILKPGSFQYEANVTSGTTVEQLLCAYWTKEQSWGSQGCTTNLKSTKVVCECDHLEGYFGVLLVEPTPTTTAPITTTSIPTTTTLATTIPTTTTPATTTTEAVVTTEPSTETETPEIITDEPINEETTVPTTSKSTTTSTVATTEIQTTTISTQTSTITAVTNSTPTISTTPLPLTTTNSTMTTTTTTTTVPSVVDDLVDQVESLLTNVTTTSNLSASLWSEWLASLSDYSTQMMAEKVLVQVSLFKAIQLTNSSLTVLDRLIGAHTVWDNLSYSAKLNSSATIFRTVGDLSLLMNNKQEDGGSDHEFRHQNIELHSKLFSNDQEGGLISFEFGDISVRLPIDGLNRSEVRFVTVTQVASTSAVLRNFSTYLSLDDQLVNSDIVSVKVGNAQTGSVHLTGTNRLTLSMVNQERLEFGDLQQCAFWDFQVDGFATLGCTVDRFHSNRTHTVCSCDHLTDFLTLTDITNREIPSVAKSVMTYVCSSVSCVFLTAAIYLSIAHNRVAYTLQQDQFGVKSNRSLISLNICVWLLLSHLLIMFGLDRTEILFICDFNSVLLLFSLLTTFSFMLMLSIHLYLCTSQHHLFRHFRFAHFAALAYGFPVIIILVSFALIFAIETPNLVDLFNSLSGEYFCWLSSTKYPYHIWIFVAPVTAIITVNTVILSSILWTVVKARRLRVTHKSKTNKPDQRDLLTAYLLLFNFGIPWILYIFYINEFMAHIFSWLFILVNGTQGVAMFAEQYLMYRSRQRKLAKRQDRLRDSCTDSTFLTSTVTTTVKNSSICSSGTTASVQSTSSGSILVKRD